VDYEDSTTQMDKLKIINMRDIDKSKQKLYEVGIDWRKKGKAYSALRESVRGGDTRFLYSQGKSGATYSNVNASLETMLKKMK
jgi:hypothetical protein